MFPSSTVTSDGSGSTIISGHFDKKIRFWDSRTDSSASDIVLNGKVTSLDLSKGKFSRTPDHPVTLKILKFLSQIANT